jgi:type I restriction enzyme S subunit
MAGEWPQQPLEEVAELSGGFAFKSEDYSPHGRFVLRTLNIKDDGSIHRDDAVFLPLEKCDLYKRFELQEHDTLFVMVGATLGKVGYVRRDTLPALLNQNMWRIRGRDGLCDKRYLQYAFRHTVAKNLGWASGSARDFVRRDDYRTMEIPVPPLADQKAIATVLGALDDKIELNRRMNVTLEAMARALFQSWFVDFDPVRAKLDGRKPVGLDDAIADLFPNSFQEADVGHIPKGWTSQSVGDVVDCVGGGTPSTKEPKYWVGGTYHWTTPKDFSSLRAPILLDTDRKLTEDGIAKISSGLLPAGTLLLSSRAPVGYLAIAAMPVAINQGFIALKCNERASNFFMLNWCQSNMAEIESRATGTTFAEISKQNFRPIRVVLPTNELMAAFTAKVAPLYAQITANLHQSRTLANLRDSLLPNLLSGAISVNEFNH